MIFYILIFSLFQKYSSLLLPSLFILIVSHHFFILFLLFILSSIFLYLFVVFSITPSISIVLGFSFSLHIFSSSSSSTSPPFFFRYVFFPIFFFNTLIFFPIFWCSKMVRDFDHHLFSFFFYELIIIYKKLRLRFVLPHLFYLFFYLLLISFTERSFA